MSAEKSESTEEMVRRLLGQQMPTWRKEDIEKKFKLVMKVYNLDVKLAASKERRKKLAEKNQKQNCVIEVSMNCLNKLGFLKYSQVTSNN